MMGRQLQHPKAKHTFASSCICNLSQ